MITGLLALLTCQLVGELLVRLLDVPVPGPVAGMVVLLVALQLREPRKDAGVVRAAEGLLRHLQLLFVPAGVGVVEHLAVIGASAVPLVVGLAVSWFAALATTAAVAAGLLTLGRRRAER
ncbi:MAG TPA: CidA/LrgA family protein [Marmoricola sp.]|nr:CidA/LrgA family protein [Marmoricola sp.]